MMHGQTNIKFIA